MRHFFLTIVLVLAFAGSAVSQIRVGFLNPQEVLDQLPEKEAIEKQLNRFLDQREMEFEEKNMTFQNNLAQFQQEAPDLSEAETNRRQEMLAAQDRELQEFQRRIQQELDQRQSELLGPVLEEMNGVIESISMERDLDYVLNEATAEGERFLMFISQEGREELDLKEQVLSRMLN